MKLSHISLRVQKYIACALHLFFLALTLCGICLMYVNDNFGVGLSRIGTVPYEDTDEFTEQFNSDLSDLFLYMEYDGVFSSGESIDVSRRVLRMTFGPNETEDFSLAELISYLQSMGYRLDEDFSCTKISEPEPGFRSREGYVDWSASEPKKISTYITPGTRRSSLEDVALEIMDILHHYYTAYNRFVANPSNLHFKIFYSDADMENTENAEDMEDVETTVFTNLDSLTPESVRTYGKYAYLPGNSIFYDTNLKTIPLSTISALASGNPYGGNSYYLLAGVDTTYPVNDLYAQNHSAYLRMQHSYMIGFGLLAFGGIVSLATLLFLLAISGRHSRTDSAVHLCGFDTTSTETGIFLVSLLTVFSLWLCRLVLVRLAHLILPEDIWDFAERCLYAAVLYLCSLLLFFSLLRRYRAGTIWTGSFLYRWKTRLAHLFTHQNFTRRLIACFIGYLLVNSILISLAWFIWDHLYTSLMAIYVLTALDVLTCLLFNLWIFYLLFRRASEQELIRDALDRLSAGETSYQLALQDFDGPELALAEGINNISAGLEMALQEKMKSERLKTDLITNVSHDIKTPLTSIINYVNLIKRENIQDPKILMYLDVLDQKSMRLKTLIEDLVEASKASSGNMKLEFSDIDLIEMAYQTNGEFEEKFENRRLNLIMTAPDEPVIIRADGRRLWRVLENLYNNACKYALEGSRIYVDIEKIRSPFAEEGAKPDQVRFTIKNISANPLNIRGEDLTERFVRGDVARTTEGSGLGLAIAKDLTTLQHGDFNLYIDGDLFKVQLTFQIQQKKASPETEPAVDPAEIAAPEKEGQAAPEAAAEAKTGADAS